MNLLLYSVKRCRCFNKPKGIAVGILESTVSTTLNELFMEAICCVGIFFRRPNYTNDEKGK